jgi:threonine/homoserine/homoserine lactone efflux protein
MKTQTVIIIIVIVLLVLFLIIKILKWPLIIAGVALLIYLGYKSLTKKKE